MTDLCVLSRIFVLKKLWRYGEVTMKKNYLFLLFFTASTWAYGFGLNDWCCTTPNGNTICSTPTNTLDLGGQEISMLDKWYFYRNCIIGGYGGSAGGGDYVGYFVADEVSYKIYKFDDKKDWENYIEKEKLKPSIWTRWYYRDWTFYDDGVFMFLLFGFFISFPLISLYIFLIYKAIVKEQFSLKKPYSRFVTLIAVLIFISWILDKFPQSF